MTHPTVIAFKICPNPRPLSMPVSLQTISTDVMIVIPEFVEPVILHDPPMRYLHCIFEFELSDSSRALRRALVGTLLASFLLLAGCRTTSDPIAGQFFDPVLQDGSILVSADAGWVDSGIDLEANEAINITSSGTVEIMNDRSKSGDSQKVVGPEGTYFYGDTLIDRDFPLPATNRGPAPVYCLIGRIDEHPPFYIGVQKSWRVNSSGRLWLRVNRSEPCNLAGHFEVTIEKTNQPVPVRSERVITASALGIPPRKKADVVVFYIDGLRPDIVHEMSAMGHLPNITEQFILGGAWLENIYTVFPSDTITANGTMWTGCFSDKHGLKAQVRFSRRTLREQSYLDTLGPHRSATLLHPEGADRLLFQAEGLSRGVLHSKESADRWSRTQVSGIPPLNSYLMKIQEKWATGVLPIMNQIPPLLWSRSLVHHMPYFQSHKSEEYIDDANTDYTIRHLLTRRDPVTVIWLPETDSISHKKGRGQFGLTRRTIAHADRLIGKILDELHNQHRLDSTYFMLVSDHGHHGGRQRSLSHFDLAHEFFFQPREVSKLGEYLGGGLGMSVRQHRLWNRHPNQSSTQFVFVDGEYDGAARIFLPRKNFQSGDWIGPQNPADLFSYAIADNLEPVNLPESLLHWKSQDSQGRLRHPVDLVLMKLAENRVLIMTADRHHAVIDRRKTKSNRWEYRYTVVENLRRNAEGKLQYDPLKNPDRDPFGILKHVSTAFLQCYLNERDWLDITAKTEYPDSVVAISRHLLWQEHLQDREREYAPDIVVTARKDWYFGNEHSPGSMHGYPLEDSMRATLFVSGPGIYRGARLTSPQRLADLTPTILALAGRFPKENEFRGEPIGALIEKFDQGVQHAEATPRREPVYWSQVDLDAWNKLDYKPRANSKLKPITVNHPSSPYDLNNIVHNLLSVGDLTVFRVADDVLTPLSGGFLTPGRFVERSESSLRHNRRRWLSEAVATLDISGISMADYSATSQGNLQRMDGSINWLQSRGTELVRKYNDRRHPVLAGVSSSIDIFQNIFWETYLLTQRVVFSLLEEGVMNNLENTADRSINSFREHPAEIVID